MSTQHTYPIVKVYTLLVRNPYLTKTWGTLLVTTNKQLVSDHRKNANHANHANQFKTTTALFRKSVWESKQSAA